jgi:hypothetical protein
MNKLDPRIATTTAVGGPPDLIGQDLVIVDEIAYRGEVVHIPRPLAGVPELVAVAEAEVKADELRDELLATLVDEGPAKWQKNTTLVVEMRAAAESAVITATVGLEAFSNHHVSRLAGPSRRSCSSGSFTYSSVAQGALGSSPRARAVPLAAWPVVHFSPERD